MNQHNNIFYQYCQGTPPFMKTKIIDLFICTLLLTNAIPLAESCKDNEINLKISNIPQKGTGGDWTQIQKLLASDGAIWDNFGFSVSLSGDTALIGARGDDSYQGSAYVFTRTGTLWTQQAKLLASDGAGEDYFGSAVSLSGDTAVIGAPLDDDNGDSSGSAYVFIRTGTTWTQEAKLLALDGAPSDSFGFSVSVFNDTTLIGAIYDDDNGDNSGSAYVFIRNETIWVQQAKLVASDGAGEDYFGSSVSLSSDTALIGMPQDDDSGDNSGSSYVFARTETTWTQQQKLTALDGAPYDSFGSAVSLCGDTALIGAVYDDDNGDNSGSTYVFVHTGTIWIQQAKLVALDGTGEDYFGSSVSLSGDTALIAAYYDDDEGIQSGSAYVFTRTDITWTQQEKILASDGTEGDFFGSSVSLSGDTALIGADSDTDNGFLSGSVYVFLNKEPPNPPRISGPAHGKTGKPHSYVFNATDPNGNELYYFIDWGDNLSSGWIGPYPSGYEISQLHTWPIKGSYTIKAKAKGIYDTESNWGILSITMPKETTYIPSLFYELTERLMVRFPHAFASLNRLLEY
jgi:FG-GAP repeat